MRVLLPLVAAALLGQPPAAQHPKHHKSIAEKKELLKDLTAKEQKLKVLMHKEKELKTLASKEQQLKKLEEKKAKLVKLEGEEKQLKKLEEKKEKLVKIEGEEKQLVKLEEKKEKLVKLEGKEKELEKLEEKKAKIEQLEEKEKELKVLEEKKAKLEAEEPHASVKASPASSEGMDAAERLLKSLGQIKKLKGTFAKDDNFGGAMQEELSKGSTIWSAIEGLEAAAQSKKNGTALASAMNAFTSTMGETLHAIDKRDEIQSEEYVLGLLAHHKHNATEQRRILGNFTNLHSVRDLLAEKPAPADVAAEYAQMLDAEHPAAKPITAFLQRLA